jgi:hypothetical protein
MLFLDLPIEILYIIGERVDYIDVINMSMLSKKANFVFSYITERTLNKFLLTHDITNIDVSDFSDISKSILLSMLFFIKKHIKNNSSEMIVMNFINTFLKRYYYRSTVSNIIMHNKCNFMLSSCLFSELQLDKIHEQLNGVIICDRGLTYKKDIINIAEKQTMWYFRRDYNVIPERGIENDIKYMITFYFFI